MYYGLFFCRLLVLRELPLPEMLLSLCTCRGGCTDWLWTDRTGPTVQRQPFNYIILGTIRHRYICSELDICT